MKRNTLFILLSAVALLFYALKQTGVNVVFISNYGNDLLYIPLICWISERIMQIVYAEFKLTLVHIILNVITASVAFEWIIPNINKTYTADILDVFCYIMGGTIYALWLMEKNTTATLQDLPTAP